MDNSFSLDISILSVNIVFTVLYFVPAIYTLCKLSRQLDKFSKTMIYLYLIGFASNYYG